MDLPTYTIYLEFGAAFLLFLAILYRACIFFIDHWRKVEKKKSVIIIFLTTLQLLIFITSFILFFMDQAKAGIEFMFVGILIMYILFVLEEKVSKLDVVAMIFLSSGASFMASSYFVTAILNNQSSLIETQQKLLDNQIKVGEFLLREVDSKIEKN